MSELALFDYQRSALDAMHRLRAEGKVKLDGLTRRDANWRTGDEEPTEGQRRMAYALGVRVPRDATKASLSALLDERAFTRALQRAQAQGEVAV